MITATTIVLIVIGGFALLGFSTGLIRSVGSIVGIIIGSVVASHNYAVVGGFLLPFLGHNEFIAGMTAFVFLFFITTAVVGFVFLFLDRMFKLVAVIPGLKALNRLGGLVFGIIEGALIVGVVLNAYMQLPVLRTKQPDVSAPVLQFLSASTKTVMPWLTSTLTSVAPASLNDLLNKTKL